MHIAIVSRVKILKERGSLFLMKLPLLNGSGQSLERRVRIQTYVDWKKLGFYKGILNYMKQNAKSDKPFSLNSHVLERVDKWEVLVSSKK